MKKLLLLVPGLVLMALLLAPAAANYVEAPANDNHVDLAQIEPIMETDALAWYGNKGNNPKEPPYGPPGWSGPPGATDWPGELQQQAVTAGWNGNNCPHGPPCGPPGWAEPPGWTPGPPGWSGPPGKAERAGELQNLTVRNAWDNSGCPDGPPCDPPGWSGPPGWIPGPPGWSGPKGK
jgi:hypothetical protein